MFKTFNERVSKIPLGISGVCVGLGGLATAWTILLQERLMDWDNATGPDRNLYTNVIQIILFIFVFLYWLLIVYRQIFVRKVFWNESNDPMLCSFIPTISMALMLISGFIAGIPGMGYLGKYVPSVNGLTIFGSILWYIAVTLHLSFVVLFFLKILRKHNFKNDDVYASWFVPPIGIIVSCTVCGNFPTEIIPQELLQAIWLFGFSLYLILLPYILYKIIFADNIHHDRIPTLAIFGAPANLALAGYLSINKFKEWGNAYWIILMILAVLSIATTFFLYVCLFKIFKTKFNPTYASLTFPTAIESVAMLKLSSAFHNIPELETFERTFNIMGYFEISVATIIVMYVFIRYTWIVIKSLFLKPKELKNK